MAASNELKVGVLVLLAGIVLVGGTLYLREWQAGSGLRTWKVGFGQVGGLSNGDPVLVQGVRRGSVDDIQLRHGQVIVSLKVKKDVVLTRNSAVEITVLGLMGERVVNIAQGPPDVAEWPADSFFPGLYASGTTEVMGTLGPILINVDSALQSVRLVAEDMRASGALQHAVHNADRSVTEMSQMVTENRAQLHAAVSNLEASTTALRHFTDTRAAKMESTVDGFAAASDELKHITAQFDSASSRLNETAGRLQRGEGTLGKLSQDSTLYVEMRRTATELHDLVADIKKNPRKYIRLSVF